MKLVIILILAISGLTFYACQPNNQTVIYNGRIEVIEKSFDNSLQDSVLIFGQVISAVDNNTPESLANIWVEQLNVETFSNDSGYYELKLPSGTYTIRCIDQYNNADMVEVLNNFELLPNEKAEINFYLGETAE